MLYMLGSKQELYREILRRKIADRAGFIESTARRLAGRSRIFICRRHARISYAHEWEAIKSKRWQKQKMHCRRRTARAV